MTIEATLNALALIGLALFWALPFVALCLLVVLVFHHTERRRRINRRLKGVGLR